MKSIRFGFVFAALLTSFSFLSGCTSNESNGTPEYNYDEVQHFEFIESKSPDPNDSLLRYEMEKMLYTPLPDELNP